MKKRCLSIVLCAMLLFSLLPLSALAAEQCTLTFDTNSSYRLDSVTADAGSSVDLSQYVPYKSGWYFAGWYTDADLTHLVNRITLNDNTILYAKWLSGNVCYLSFETNGGSALRTEGYGPGVSVSLDSFIPTREGFNFAGWYSDSNLRSPIRTVTLSRNTTVYAKWEHPTYTLSFATPDASSVDSISMPSGSVISLSDYTSTKPGFVFTGWYNETGTTQITSVTLTKNTTVYAGWSAAADVKTLTFHTNGGDTISSVSKAKGTIIDLSEYVPTKSRSVFTGWYSDSDLTQSISRVILNQDVTVYAGWDNYQNACTLTLNPNGGSIGTSSITRPAGEWVDLSQYVPTRYGDSFTGWYRDSSLRNRITGLYLDGNTTVYAGWSSGTGAVCTLSFNTNGGNKISSVTKSYGTSVKLSNYEPTRDGYAFAGWYTDKYLNNKVTSVTLYEDTTVYAKWSDESYTLYFDTNGGSKLSSITEDYGATIKLAGYEPVRDGYAFVGWFSNSKLTKEVTKITLTGDTTVYAKWSDETCILSFNTNGGSAIGSVVKAVDTTVDLSDFEPTKDGCVFVGWYTDKDLTDEVTEITLEEDTVLYAKWSEKPCTLSFNSNGGSAVGTVLKPYGEEVSLAAYTPTRAGYVFDGWYTNTSYATRLTTLTMTKDTTVYAKWTASEVKNTFTDVKQSDYFYDAVLWAMANGITSGVDDTHFAPETSCTRAQTVTFLWRAAGSPAPASSSCPFLDINRNAYYYKAVIWAVEKGITTGTSDYTFSPNETVNRGQTVTFLYRFSKGTAPNISCPFRDVKSSDYFYNAVLWAHQNKITSGIEANIFGPGEHCLRNQTVTFLYRCLGT